MPPCDICLLAVQCGTMFSMSRRLERGWSRPVKASEVADLFPMARTIQWTDGPLPEWRQKRRGIVVSLGHNRGSVQPQPELNLCAVPSDVRKAVEEWVRSVVVVEAARWWSEASASEARLATGLVHRYWTYDVGDG